MTVLRRIERERKKEKKREREREREREKERNKMFWCKMFVPNKAISNVPNSEPEMAVFNEQKILPRRHWSVTVARLVSRTVNELWRSHCLLCRYRT